MVKKVFGMSILALTLIGCGAEPLYAIDFANPVLVKEADQVGYASGASPTRYDSNKEDVSTFIDVLKRMKVTKIKPDPPITGNTGISLNKGTEQIIGIAFINQHITINNNTYEYQLDSKANQTFKQLLEKLRTNVEK